MQWSVIRTLDELNALANEWNDLLACSASHVPFLRHEYLCGWWKTLGGGEWPSGELFVVIARSPAGKLIGIAPLFFTKNLDGEAALMFLGSIEISDYLDVIACREQLPEFIDGLMNFLSGPQAPAWKLLDLYNILDASPLLPVLEEKAAAAHWDFQQEALQHCPAISLPGDWETYLGSIDKKQRHEIRRKMRRAQEVGLPVGWYIVQQSEKLEEEVEAFMSLMAQDPAKDHFLTPPMRAQMQITARAAFDAGWLQLAFMTVNGVKAAGYFNFDYDGHIWVYNSGLNFEMRELSPGWVLLGNLLQWANENQRRTFDFMRGDEDYKYRFGGVDRRVVRVKIRR